MGFQLTLIVKYLNISLLPYTICLLHIPQFYYDFILRVLLYKMLVIPLDENLLKHISPLNWSHINFLGEYSFQSNMALGLNEYRPLKV